GEVGNQLAVAAEGRVQAPSGCIAGEGEPAAAAARSSHGHDLLVAGLDGHPQGDIVTCGEVGNELAVTAEGSVQGPIGVVPGQAKPAAAASRLSRGHNLPAG